MGMGEERWKSLFKEEMVIKLAFHWSFMNIIKSSLNWILNFKMLNFLIYFDLTAFSLAHVKRHIKISWNVCFKIYPYKAMLFRTWVCIFYFISVLPSNSDHSLLTPSGECLCFSLLKCWISILVTLTQNQEWVKFLMAGILKSERPVNLDFMLVKQI